MDWNSATKYAEQQTSNGSKVFLRFKQDGDKAVVVILGEPEQRKVVWEGSRMVDYDDLLHAKEKPKVKWLLNVFVPAEKEVKILECGAQLFREIANVREKFSFDEWLFEIKRRGHPGDTKTTYSILPDKQIPDTWKASIAKLELIDLKQYAGKKETTHLPAPQSEEQRVAAQAAEFGDDNLPF